jgi:hypothetical protein
VPEQFSKAVSKQLFELAAAAHEEALRRALVELDTHFERWRRNEIDSFELEARIHEFHQGASREIFNQFGIDRVADRPRKVAYGVAAGLIDESVLPPEIRPCVEKWLATYREL